MSPGEADRLTPGKNGAFYKTKSGAGERGEIDGRELDSRKYRIKIELPPKSRWPQDMPTSWHAGCYYAAGAPHTTAALLARSSDRTLKNS